MHRLSSLFQLKSIFIHTININTQYYLENLDANTLDRKSVCVCGGGGRPLRDLHPWDGLRLINAVEVLFIVSLSKLMLIN